MKKIKGSYVEVVDTLKMPKGFNLPSTPKQYDEDIALDLNRICYVNFSGSVESMKKKLADRSKLEDTELSYTQGNFYAGVFSQTAVYISPCFIEAVKKASDLELGQDLYNSFGFTYEDDDGRLCGFSITRIRDDKDLTIPLENRTWNYVVSVIKDVTLPPPKRKVTVFVDTRFLTGGLVGEAVDGASLAKEIDELIGSESISQLTKGLIDDAGLINKDKYRELEKRIVSGYNVDDRDNKLEAFADMFIIWLYLMLDESQSSKKDELLDELNSHIKGALCSIDYFKDKSLADIDRMVATYKKNELIISACLTKNRLDAYAKVYGYKDFSQLNEVMSRSFLHRNQLPLILAALVVVAIVAVACMFSGFLAPVAVLATLGLVDCCLQIRENENHNKIIHKGVETQLRSGRLFFTHSLSEESNGAAELNSYQLCSVS